MSSVTFCSCSDQQNDHGNTFSTLSQNLKCRRRTSCNPTGAVSGRSSSAMMEGDHGERGGAGDAGIPCAEGPMQLQPDKIWEAVCGPAMLSGKCLPHQTAPIHEPWEERKSCDSATHPLAKHPIRGEARGGGPTGTPGGSWDGSAGLRGAGPWVGAMDQAHA